MENCNVVNRMWYRCFPHPYNIGDEVVFRFGQTAKKGRIISIADNLDSSPRYVYGISVDTNGDGDGIVWSIGDVKVFGLYYGDVEDEEEEKEEMSKETAMGLTVMVQRLSEKVVRKDTKDVVKRQLEQVCKELLDAQLCVQYVTKRMNRVEDRAIKTLVDSGMEEGQARKWLAELAEEVIDELSYNELEDEDDDEWLRLGTVGKRKPENG